MLATEGEETYDAAHPLEGKYSYFEHEWTGQEGMFYMTGRTYRSKTFTDFTHPMSEIIGSMCANGIVITGMQESDHDISGGFEALEGQGYPLSMILEGRKLG